MRPPSYYASIVKSNHSNHYSSTDFDTSTASSSGYSRASSQQLRSSLAVPSSSSYASRSHLPFVAQSSLVAHCLTAPSSAYISAAASSSLASSRSPSTKRYTSSSGTYRSSYTSSPSSSLSAYSTSSLRSSTYNQRPATSASAASLRPSYRPIGSPSSSSYYRPIRLRERPLLAQISNQIRESSRTPENKQHSKTSEATSEKQHNETKKDSLELNEPQDNDTWSSDITRNISRNKYLIKFREIDKARPSLGEINQQTRLEIGEIIQDDKTAQLEQQRRTRENQVPERENFELEKKDIEKLSSQDKASMKFLEKQEQILPSDSGRLKEKLHLNGDTDVNQTSVADIISSVAQPKKERRNVRLKLKPIGTKKKNANELQQQQQEALIESNSTETRSAEKILIPDSVSKSKPEPSTQVPEVATKDDVEQPETARPSDIAEPKVRGSKVKSRLMKQDSKTSKLETSPQVVSEQDKSIELRCSNETGPTTAKKSTKIKKIKTTGESGGKVRKKKSLDKISIDAKIEVEKENENPISKAIGGRIRFRAYNHDDFNFLTVLGHGGWGFVILAELKNHREACFAIKCIKKITIVEDDDYDSIMIERRVLTLGNVNPFICKLFCTYQTSGYLFFAMEFCPGGDLMFHVQREERFDEDRCRFYAAEIICAIKFLHNRHIIYRDLKLDNILLDAEGHIRLVDFGMCQCRTYREEMLPSNFCGTPEYISPEIIKGVPYNHSVDWWSFGVLLYEMAVGKMPFRGNDENELLWNVCYEQIHYPMFLSKELTSLLKLLLEREPIKRMGMATCKAGDIHDQPFFHSVDWKAVEALQVPPPFVPQVDSNRDVQNFDTDFTKSTCELEPVDEETLIKIDQANFEQFPYTNPDISIFDRKQSICN